MTCASNKGDESQLNFYGGHLDFRVRTVDGL